MRWKVPEADQGLFVALAGLVVAPDCLSEILLDAKSIAIALAQLHQGTIVVHGGCNGVVEEGGFGLFIDPVSFFEHYSQEVVGF